MPNATSSRDPFAVATERGWRVFQKDGRWYVHPRDFGPGTDGDRQQDIGEGASPADAVADALAREARKAAESDATTGAPRAAKAPPAPVEVEDE